MPARRYYIQHIGGDPILLRFVVRDSPIRHPDGSWSVRWTDHPDPAVAAEERHEWETSTEAHAIRTALQKGTVHHTPPDQPDLDLEATQPHQPPPPEIPPEIIADKDIPWWHR